MFVRVKVKRGREGRDMLVNTDNISFVDIEKQEIWTIGHVYYYEKIIDGFDKLLEAVENKK